MRKCPICGSYFVIPKYAWNKLYCDAWCKRIVVNKKSAEYMRKQRKLSGDSFIQNSLKNGTSVLSDLSIIKVNGQERIKGAYILERLILKLKHNV